MSAHGAASSAAKPVPAEGQVWADNDPRSSGRQIRVIWVGQEKAIVETIRSVGGEPVPFGKRRRTRISLERFRPDRTGYTLLTEPKPSTERGALAEGAVR